MIKVGMGILGPGYFTLPYGIELVCPQCGAMVSKEKAEIKLGSGDEGGFSLELDCKVCGCNHKNPMSSVMYAEKVEGR